ncbi:MAG: pirin family protein [Flavobacteriales bacterium]|nr:pirin family protein [Flavobacteriales bacterium]
MNINVIKKNQQASGQFNGGEILENKPIGFPREGGQLKPYSNLFYWAHAWSEKGSTIGLHPHQGFEILSFVLQGSIEHFDTKLNRWLSLKKGAAQIIRAGNGISHSEKLNEGAHMFQIWFDPNLDKTLQEEASYDDYSIDKFPIEQVDGLKKTTYKGAGSPLFMDAPEVEIYNYEFQVGKHQIELDESKIYSAYLISGNMNINEEFLENDDFFILENSSTVQLEILKETILFVVATPKELDYKTYAKRMMQ